jgi:hypothetical protein
MVHVTEVSTCNNNETLQTIGQKRWVTYSFDIAIKVKGEGCTVESLEMLKIPNVMCGKLDNLQLQMSIMQSCIASSMQRIVVIITFRALMFPII